MDIIFACQYALLIILNTVALICCTNFNTYSSWHSP